MIRKLLGTKKDLPDANDWYTFKYEAEEDEQAGEFHLGPPRSFPQHSTDPEVNVFDTVIYAVPSMKGDSF